VTARDDLAKPILHANTRHEAHHEPEREAHHGEVVAVDSRDDGRAKSLDPIGAGLVHRLTRRDVPHDVRFREVANRDVHRFDVRHDAAVARDSDRRQHDVLPPGESAQHGACLGLVAWLAEDVAVHHDDRVGGDDHRVRLPLGDDSRLSSRQTLRVRARLLRGERRLVDVRG